MPPKRTRTAKAEENAMATDDEVLPAKNAKVTRGKGKSDEVSVAPALSTKKKNAKKDLPVEKNEDISESKATNTKKQNGKEKKEAPAKKSVKRKKQAVAEEESFENNDDGEQSEEAPKAKTRKTRKTEDENDVKSTTTKKTKKNTKVFQDEDEEEKETTDETSDQSETTDTKNTRAQKNKKETSQEKLTEDEEVEDEKKSLNQKKETAAKKATENKSKAASKEESSKNEKTLMNKVQSDLNKINFDCDKKDKNGNKYNLKICSWNVSGIRAVIKKNGMDYIIKENADIILLQETKCANNKLPSEIKIPGYHHYYFDSEKPGYCGVALYTKEKPISVKIGLAKSNYDKEGRLITAEFDKFNIINAYVPNSGRKLVSLPKRLIWNEAFKNHVTKLDKKKPVIICGDLNVAHQEIDLKNPKTNTKNAGFTKEERDGMTELLQCGFVDTFRKLYPDKKDAYTFWSYLMNSRAKDVGWRLDYFLVSERISDQICDNVIRSQVYGSDHCPIVLYANL